MEPRAANMVEKRSTADHASSPLLCIKKQNTFKTMACQCSFGGGDDYKNRSFVLLYFYKICISCPLKEK